MACIHDWICANTAAAPVSIKGESVQWKKVERNEMRRIRYRAVEDVSFLPSLPLATQSSFPLSGHILQSCFVPFLSPPIPAQFDVKKRRECASNWAQLLTWHAIRSSIFLLFCLPQSAVATAALLSSYLSLSSEESGVSVIVPPHPTPFAPLLLYICI